MSICIASEIDSYVPSYEDVRMKALRKFVEKVYVPRSIRRQGVERARVVRYMLKAEKVFQVVASELGRVARLPKTGSMHPFYAELVNLASDGMYDQVIERAQKAVKIVAKLWREYRPRILACYTGVEAKDLAREFVGRALSVAKRALRNSDKVREAVRVLKKTPCIDPNEPTMIIAGMPQVGKSTLVSRISSAKPEIAPYPFTTKHIILGHFTWNNIRIQVIDTPGILDRPVEEMNPIERKAVAALKHLRAVTIFLIDPCRDAYYSLDRQLNVLRSVSNFVGRDRLIVALNKIDAVDEDRLREVEDILRNEGYDRLVRISALYGYGLEELVERAMELIKALYG